MGSRAGDGVGEEMKEGEEQGEIGDLVLIPGRSGGQSRPPGTHSLCAFLHIILQ